MSRSLSPSRAGPCTLAASLVVAGLLACAQHEEERAALRFVDITAAAGVEGTGPTFGAALVDVDDDGDEDLFVSRHGLGPGLFLNEDAGQSLERGSADTEGGVSFRDATPLLPRSRGDRHGVLVLDLDGDGDRDLAMACGGGDGVGPGCANRLFQSLLADSGELAFADASSALGEAAASERRSRAFLPITSAGGESLDLLLTAKPRRGYPDLLLRNDSRSGELAFSLVLESPLSQELDTEGLDLVLDVERDGDRDVVLIDGERLRLFVAENGTYVEREAGLGVATRVRSAAAGDLDGDGLPDLLVGTHPPDSGSDHVLRRGDRIHFLVLAQENDGGEEIGFVSDGDLELDLTFKRGRLEESSALFLGEEARPSPARMTVRREDAAGVRAPSARTRAGTYLGWRDGRWTLAWKHSGRGDSLRGSLRGEALRDLTRSGLEELDAAETHDLLLLNRLATAGRFVAVDDGRTPEALAHRRVTEALALVDLDCDGALDVIALRAGEQGAENGGPVVLRNFGDGELVVGRESGLGSSEDDLYTADQLVVGFVDGDLRPDLFITHGGGLRPGSLGPFRLYVNRTVGGGGCVGLDLKGAPPNREALGAQVDLFDGEERIGYRELGAGIHRSQSSTLVHFGVGALPGPLRARIRWPRGQVSEHAVAVGERLSVSEPEVSP